MTHRLLIPVTPGELLDRLTILRLKLRRMTNREKLAKVGAELQEVSGVWDRSPYSIRMSNHLVHCLRELQEANEDIWDSENEIRNQGVFGPGGAAAALKARDANDRRTDLKARINAELDVETVEVKEYGGSHAQAEGQSG